MAYPRVAPDQHNTTGLGRPSRLTSNCEIDVPSRAHPHNPGGRQRFHVACLLQAGETCRMPPLPAGSCHHQPGVRATLSPCTRRRRAACGRGTKRCALAAAFEPLECDCPLVALRITIENRSETEAVIRYDQFALKTHGGRLPSLPLFDIGNPTPPIPSSYRFPWSGFRLAPHLSGRYRGFWNGTNAQAGAKGYYQKHHATLQSLMAPTLALKRRALPEGVLEPGGHITGLLFFQRPPEPANLIAKLTAAESNRRIAQFDLPITLQIP